MEDFIDILNRLFEYRTIRIITIGFVIAIAIFYVVIKTREMVNRKKAGASTKKIEKKPKPKRTHAERIGLYKASVGLSLLAVLLAGGYVAYAFQHEAEFKDDSSFYISIFIAVAIAVLFIANIIRLYAQKSELIVKFRRINQMP